MEPRVDPAHIDCNAQLFRAHRTLADAIRRAEAAEAAYEHERARAETLERAAVAVQEQAVAAEKERDALRTQLAARPAANGATSDGRRRVTWNRRPGDTIAHLYVEKVTVCAVPVADVEKAAAVLETVINGIVAIERARLTGTGDDVRDAFIGAATDAARAMNGEAARPAAESVAVPPEDAEALARRWLVQHYYKPNAITGDIADWMGGKGGRVDLDVEESLESTTAWFRAHWPRAVSSDYGLREEHGALKKAYHEVLGVLAGTEDDPETAVARDVSKAIADARAASSEEVERLRRLWNEEEDRCRYWFQRAQDAEALCNALMSAGLAECTRLRCSDAGWKPRAERAEREVEKLTWKLRVSPEVDMAEIERIARVAEREAAARAQGAAEERAKLLDELATRRSWLSEEQDTTDVYVRGQLYENDWCHRAVRLRARAAAAGAEGKTRLHVDPNVTPEQIREAMHGGGPPCTCFHAPEQHAPDGPCTMVGCECKGYPREPASSPPPCAACGGSGRCPCGGEHEPDADFCPKCNAPPPASSATAGEDDIEDRVARHLHAHSSEMRGCDDQTKAFACILTLVRSERRRARAEALEAVVKVCEAEVAKVDPWDMRYVVATQTVTGMVRVIRALGGEKENKT